jgi:Fic family protein
MSATIHAFNLELTMKLLSKISKVDRFDASWTQLEKREGQMLKQLKAIATVRSVGASTRIEGSKMTDKEVEVLIEKLNVSKLEERDQQEVAGYFETLYTISEAYRDIDITESNIKNLHRILMKYAKKDEWHKGDYKQLSNAVEATHPDGSKQVIFKTAEPGLETQEAMKKLFEWYHADQETSPVIKIALFVYEFLSVHPFQDGNGRLSRLLGTLLLLRHGYSWIQYVSFEHEIENRKAEYYKILMQTQKQRPGEKVDDWLFFFLNCMLNIQDHLNAKLETKAHSTRVFAPREKNLLAFIENHPGSKSSEMAEKLDIPLSTVKKMLTTMVENKKIIKYGVGAGTNYLVEIKSPLKPDRMFQLTNISRKKELLLITPESFIEIKKIILTPLFDWVKPDEWAIKLMVQGIHFKITGVTVKKDSFSTLHPLTSFNSEHYFQPVFTLANPIHIPLSVKNKIPNINEYPIKIEIELLASVATIDFDVMFVYDEV